MRYSINSNDSRVQIESEPWGIEEVSQGILRDGRWTVNHPSVMDYVNKTRKEHGFSLLTNLLTSFPPPGDLRTYALVALQMQSYYNWPVWWVILRVGQKDMTKNAIEMQLRSKYSFCTFGPSRLQ
ncbi:hypothetical protein NEOLEDRAFT_1142552 [Neolentinus lepideus HHB14362 ss-1]|uniref:Uncharacterized protein n=1 Tax=Neolentinus lepideus HHB14362 ss-1 TaxID=1314782 RepID=A0A165N1E8_9AGAM|nr:hypothetical protein NEOLEDRAFT_1142552 [Neolentinus lepideus HHB14362 ss-1]